MTVKYCGSVPVKIFDGDKPESIGWMYGFHFLSDDDESETCPRCGVELNRAQPDEQKK